MAVKNTFVLILIIFHVFCCKKRTEPKVAPSEPKGISPHDIKSITPHEARTYYKNPKSKYKYRTGLYGFYEYDYEVIGTNDQGLEVLGEVIVMGRYGAGIVKTKEDSLIEIKVEWIGQGKLKGTDDHGHHFKLDIK